MIYLQPTKNAETIADYLHENGKQWQTKETVSIPHSFAGLKFTKGVSNTQTVKKINDVFRRVYGVEIDSLFALNKNGKITREQPIKDYRHAYRYWLAAYTSLSLKTIGKHSGGCDHSTICHSKSEYIRLKKQLPFLRDNHDRFKQLMA